MIRKIRPIIKALVVLAAVLRAFSLDSFAGAPIAVEVQRITVNDTQYSNQFGSSVAVAGDWMVAGALYDDDVGFDAGAAYIFRREVGQWVLHTKIYPTGESGHDLFGGAVAMAGDWIAVGAEHDSFHSWEKGSAYVFRRHDPGTPNNLSDDRWIQEAKLLRPGSKSNDSFGMSLAMTTDGILVVGSYGNEFLPGSAEVFRYCAGSWSHEKTLVGDDTVAEDWFGSAVDIDGDTVVVGAIEQGGAVERSGAVYVFEGKKSGWKQIVKLLASDGVEVDRFGSSVAIHGTKIFVGALGVDRGARLGTGAAYMFDRENDCWRESQKLEVLESHGADNFGETIEYSGSFAIIGSGGFDQRGAGFLWTECNGRWFPNHKIVTHDAGSSPAFSVGMAIEGRQVSIGWLGGIDVFDFNGPLFLYGFALYQRCAGFVSGHPGCDSFDFTQDSTVDVGDYSQLLNCWTCP